MDGGQRAMSQRINIAFGNYSQNVYIRLWQSQRAEEGLINFQVFLEFRPRHIELHFNEDGVGEFWVWLQRLHFTSDIDFRADMDE